MQASSKVLAVCKSKNNKQYPLGERQLWLWEDKVIMFRLSLKK